MRVHHGSGDVPARVVFFTGKIGGGERALAQLRLEAPAFVFAGDRFVLRDWAEQNTLAGGVVLDERQAAPCCTERHVRVFSISARPPPRCASFHPFAIAA